MSGYVIIPKGDGAMRLRVSQRIGALDPKYAWRVEVKRHVKRRTNAQNALMWAWLNEVVEIIGKHTGYDSDELHIFFKKKFLPASGRTRKVIAGTEIEKRSTKELSTVEFSEYLDAIDRWAAEFLGVSLPDRQRL